MAYAHLWALSLIGGASGRLQLLPQLVQLMLQQPQQFLLLPEPPPQLRDGRRVLCLTALQRIDGEVGDLVRVRVRVRAEVRVRLRGKRLRGIDGQVGDLRLLVPLRQQRPG